MECITVLPVRLSDCSLLAFNLKTKKSKKKTKISVNVS